MNKRELLLALEGMEDYDEVVMQIPNIPDQDIEGDVTCDKCGEEVHYTDYADGRRGSVDSVTSIIPDRGNGKIILSGDSP